MFFVDCGQNFKIAGKVKFSKRYLCTKSVLRLSTNLHFAEFETEAFSSKTA